MALVSTLVDTAVAICDAICCWTYSVDGIFATADIGAQIKKVVNSFLCIAFLLSFAIKKPPIFSSGQEVNDN